MEFAHSSLITLLHAHVLMVTLVSTAMFHQLIWSQQLLPRPQRHQSHVQLVLTFARTTELVLSIQPWMSFSATASQALLVQLALLSSHSAQVVLARTAVLVWLPTFQLLEMASAHVPLDSQAQHATLVHAVRQPTVTTMVSVSPTMVWSRVYAFRELDQTVPKSMEPLLGW